MPGEEHLPTAALNASLTCARAGFALWWIGVWFVCEALASEED